MTNPANQWQQICNEYLAKVKSVLAGASPDEKQQILDDIDAHLSQSYNELPEEQRTWENFQQIITDLGPVEDYADLLQGKPRVKQTKKRKSLIVWISACIFIFVLINFLPTLILPLLIKHQQSKRPIVLKTSPQTLSTSVDPATTEITVTFDQPMMNFSWSWVGGGEHYPETTGDPKYGKERKTCTLPVKLKPGHWYWIGINSEYYVYFQTEKHVPAKPYVILFATADENGNPTEIPIEYIEEAKRINSE